MLILWEISSSGCTKIAEEFFFTNNTINCEFSYDGKIFIIKKDDNKTIDIYDALALKKLKTVIWDSPQDDQNNYYNYYGVNFFLSYDGAYIFQKENTKVKMFNNDGAFVKSMEFYNLIDLKVYWYDRLDPQNSSAKSSKHEFLLYKSQEYSKYVISLYNFMNETEVPIYNIDTYSYYMRIIGNSSLIYYGDYSTNYIVNVETKESVKLDSKWSSSTILSSFGNKILFWYYDWPNYNICAYNGTKKLWDKSLAGDFYPNGVWFTDDDKTSFYLITYTQSNVKIMKKNENTDIITNLDLVKNFYFKYPYLIWIRIQKEIWYFNITNNTANIIYLNAYVAATENLLHSINIDDDTSISLALDFIDHYKICTFSIKYQNMSYFTREFYKNKFSDPNMIWFYRARVNNLK